ncbi:glycosyltransferase [Desulfatirhabdium butyrativorans]|uniref:glycosyltransferase n=1 Tax=Desulfatirhabdium butyrativorans TaxID=340467 RepID=UPI0004840D6F|nr:glycosyltransferase [Desulfatirhabdium butyrativorans]
MSSPTIGMILKGYPRISETFISNEILLLEELGFSFHIVSMRKPRESFTHRSVARIRATVDYLPETILSGLTAFLASSARLALSRPKSLRTACQIAARRFSRTGKSASIKHLLQAVYLIDRVLPHHAISHFHAHFAHSPTSVALYASILSGIPFSFTAHAKDIYTSNPWQLAEKIDRSTFVITCTEYNRLHLRKLPVCGNTPIFRVYHGIDLELFQAPDRAASEQKPPFRLLTVARLAPKKGIHTVLQALQGLASQELPFLYTVIGDGDEKDRLTRLARDLGIADRIQWLGTQPHDVVLAHYRNSDLFLIGCEIAANGDRDGIPNVLVESMAMGVPVVATRVSAIPELVENEKNGILVEPGDADAMARQIMRILSDTHLRERLIAEARQKVAQHFDHRKLIRELAGIYRENTAVGGRL